MITGSKFDSRFGYALLCPWKGTLTEVAFLILPQYLLGGSTERKTCRRNQK